MKKIYIITIFLGLLIVFQEASAQQDPQYTQYMYNLNVINPAYAGSKESLSITALYRNQWAGIADNPETFTFAAHSPFGIQFCTDKDLGWNGTIENGFVSEFVDREYDVLINYYTDDKLVLKILTARTNARIKVGFPSVDAKLNDLIFDTPIKNFDVFKTELKKYLKVLNEIK